MDLKMQLNSFPPLPGHVSTDADVSAKVSPPRGAPPLSEQFSQSSQIADKWAVYEGGLQQQHEDLIRTNRELKEVLGDLHEKKTMGERNRLVEMEKRVATLNIVRQSLGLEIQQMQAKATAVSSEVSERGSKNTILQEKHNTNLEAINRFHASLATLSETLQSTTAAMGSLSAAEPNQDLVNEIESLKRQKVLLASQISEWEDKIRLASTSSYQTEFAKLTRCRETVVSSVPKEQFLKLQQVMDVYRAMLQCVKTRDSLHPPMNESPRINNIGKNAVITPQLVRELSMVQFEDVTVALSPQSGFAEQYCLRAIPGSRITLFSKVDPIAASCDVPLETVTSVDMSSHSLMIKHFKGMINVQVATVEKLQAVFSILQVLLGHEVATPVHYVKYTTILQLEGLVVSQVETGMKPMTCRLRLEPNYFIITTETNETALRWSAVQSISTADRYTVTATTASKGIFRIVPRSPTQYSCLLTMLSLLHSTEPPSRMPVATPMHRN